MLTIISRYPDRSEHFEATAAPPVEKWLRAESVVGAVAIQAFVHCKHVKDDGTSAFGRDADGLFENERQRWFDAVTEPEWVLEQLFGSLRPPKGGFGEPCSP